MQIINNLGDTIGLTPIMVTDNSRKDYSIDLKFDLPIYGISVNYAVNGIHYCCEYIALVLDILKRVNITPSVIETEIDSNEYDYLIFVKNEPELMAKFLSIDNTNNIEGE